eukprot:gb/GECG01014501.1/.p1 GENE.gb/GECG01014501.1/~~gb/GECG01014501.1/.p1  ORF type:complete len:216 (+),score=39.13 gb/GECG01014501.1/:1-648(+)
MQQHTRSAASVSSSGRHSATRSRLGISTNDVSGIKSLSSNKHTLSSLYKDSRPENDDAHNLVELERHPMLRHSADQRTRLSQQQQQSKWDSSSSGEEDEEEVENPAEVLEKYMQREQQQEREEHERRLDYGMSDFVDDVLCKAHNVSRTGSSWEYPSTETQGAETKLRQLAGRLYPDHQSGSDFCSTGSASAALEKAHDRDMERLECIANRINNV